MFVYGSTSYYISPAITPLLSRLFAIFFPLKMKTTDNAFISQHGSLALFVRRFESHLTCTGLITASFSA
jgi:hypothetical protein